MIPECPKGPERDARPEEETPLGPPCACSSCLSWRARREARPLRERVAHEISRVDGHASSVEPCGDATYEQMADAALAVVTPELERLTAEVAHYRFLWNNAARRADNLSGTVQELQEKLRITRALLHGMAARASDFRRKARLMAASSERFFHASRAKAQEIERLQVQYDQAVEDWGRNDEQMLAENQRLADERDRLREQLAAQPTPQMIAAKLREMNAADPDDDTMPVFWPLDDEHEGGIRHWTSVEAVAGKLAEVWGVSSSEVEAPQPPKMAQHKVRVTKLLGSGQSVAVCPGCRAGMTGADQEAEDWKDQHEADTLRPVLTDDSAKLTDESSISQKDEGRPSATGAATPRWREGDIAIDQSNFVHRRFGHGWRTWPRESGLQYGDALMESGLGPMLRLDEVPAETDAHGHVPVLVAERVRAAQAARSEATPRVWAEVDLQPCPEDVRQVLDCNNFVWRRLVNDQWITGHQGDGPCGWPYLIKKFGPLTEVPSPSLRKEGEDRG